MPPHPMNSHLSVEPNILDTNSLTETVITTYWLR